jgi:hypothetical protein
MLQVFSLFGHILQSAQEANQFYQYEPETRYTLVLTLEGSQAEFTLCSTIRRYRQKHAFRC